MLALDRCRKLIKTEAELSDRQVEEIRDSLYGIAQVIVAEFLKNAQTERYMRNHGKNFSAFMKILTHQEQEELEKLVATVGMENSLSHDEVEREAITRFINAKKN